MAIERMNYFKGEFLHEEDFKVEQKYHVDMRRRHNQYLHTPGIIYGLKVTPGNGQVTIAPGMAMDALGREIIIETAKDIPVSSTTIIALKYKEELTLDSSETGISGKKRWTESAEIVTAAGPDTISIAKVNNATTSPVTLDPAFKPQYSGPAVMGDLVIEGDLTVKGTATTVNTETLEVEDNIIRVNKYAPQPTPKNVNGGLEVYRGGTAPNAQILWDEGVDKWKIGLEGSLVDILDSSHKHNSLSTPAGSQALSVDAAGNVGIGVMGPKAKLHTVGDLVLGLDENNKKFIFHSRTNGNGDFLQITHDKTDGSWDWSQGITLKRGGNVGIGTIDPKAKLHISGNAGILNLEGTDHAYIQWFPQSFANGRKAWIGFGGAGATALTIQNDAGRMHIYGTELLYLLNKDGVVIGKEWGGNGNLTVEGNVNVNGDIRAGNSDIYFTKTNHNHTGTGNTAGYAAIENAADYGALMILGRAGTPKGRTVKLWDYLQVNGDLELTGAMNCPRFRVTQVFRDVTGALPKNLNFTSGGGVLVILASGSGWSNIVNKTIGMQINLDGIMMGVAKVFTNEASSHKAFVAAPIVITGNARQAGNHTLELFRMNLDTQTDGNDFYNVTVLELPF